MQTTSLFRETILGQLIRIGSRDRFLRYDCEEATDPPLCNLPCCSAGTTDPSEENRYSYLPEIVPEGFKIDLNSRNQKLDTTIPAEEDDGENIVSISDVEFGHEEEACTQRSSGDLVCRNPYDAANLHNWPTRDKVFVAVII